jgi:RNA 3'-terminal phosphate cyclase (ATP)
MELLGLRLELRMRRPGFYPRGGGLLEAHIGPCPALRGIEIDHLEPPAKIRGFSAVAGLPEHICRRQAERVRHRLRDIQLALDIREETWSGGPGTVVGLALDTRPVPTFFFALGERGKPAERVADEAVNQVTRYLKLDPPAVDEHSGDQLLLPLALAAGPSRFPVAAVTSHLLTNAAVIRRFIDRAIEIEGDEGCAGVVRMAGARDPLP